jgi:hypothetical protein
MKQIQRGDFWILVIASALLMVYPMSAQAATSVLNALQTFSNSFPYLWNLVTAAAYLIGFVFMLRSIHGFKEYGESSRGGHGGHGLKLPLVLFFVGSALIFSPSVVRTIMLSTFGYGSALQYPETGGADWNKYWPVLALIQLVGAISFIRGWVMIVGSAQQGGHTPLGKAITHIVGGIFAINISGTIDMMRKTFGF